MLRGHCVLDCFQLRRIEFDDLSALLADHVIVVLMFVIIFVMGAPVAEADLAGQAGVGQQPQRAIDSGLAHAGILFVHQAIQVFT